MDRVHFFHPEPPRARTRIWPVFIPFAGCPCRCVFCAQQQQTGCTQTGLDEVLLQTEAELQKAFELGRGPYELAFFGGTFTALPTAYMERFLTLADKFRKLGLIIKTRCSTRPDAVTIPLLQRLASLGLDMVELGIQSFDDTALQASRRGYTGEQAKNGCAIVQEAGLELGVQLMPGLPGDHAHVFQQDVLTTCAIKPENTRLYPCLVLRSTLLETWWEQQEYTPWTLEKTQQELAQAVDSLWSNRIAVIRMGVAPEENLQPYIVAGPWHPALGQSVRGLVLLAHIRKHCATLSRAPRQLLAPQRYSGELFGHGKELAKSYEQLGFSAECIQFVQEEQFIIY